MKKSSTLINNRIKIYENKNEFILTFSCATDVSKLVEYNTQIRPALKDLDAIAYQKYGIETEPIDCDMPVSFKMADGSINWEKLEEYRKSKNEEYQKAQSSIYRAKTTIYDLMQSNYWEYFVTITVNPSSDFMKDVDIKDVKAVQYKVTDLIRNLNRRRKQKIKYVLIPEYQQNGNVHFHGVVAGIDENDLKTAINNQEYRKDKDGNIMVNEYGDPVPNEFYLQPLVRKGNQVYNHKTFEKIGYNDFEIIRDMSRVGSYCTKYITKDLFERSNEYGAHLYICSKGLERKEKIYERYTDEFKYLSDSEIKEGINENAYIVRSDYSTKVTINKKYLKDKNKIIQFADNINVRTIENGVEDVPASQKRIDPFFLAHLLESQLNSMGIGSFDSNTGEISIMTGKNPIERITYDKNTDSIIKSYDIPLSFNHLEKQRIENELEYHFEKGLKKEQMPL